MRSVLTVSKRSYSVLSEALGKIPSVELNYDLHEPKVVKNGNPLILLHGIFGSRNTHRSVGKALANRLSRQVYCPDLRNHGNSPHDPRMDYPALASDVENFIHQHKIQKPIVIGHSMGAKTAMAIPLRNPNLIKMLIAVDNAPINVVDTGSSFTRYISSIKKSLEFYKFKNIKDVDNELAKVEPNQVIRAFLLTNMNRGKADEYITSKIPLDYINNALVAGNISAWPFDSNETRWSRGPVLFVRGTESNYVPDEAIPEIGKFFPNFELRDMKTGHWVISEKPNEFIDLVVDFIEKNEEL